MSRPAHALSVDVEDWYSGTVLALEGHVAPPTDAVERNSRRLIELFAAHGAKATWFVLGEVAEAFPRLVRHIAAEGHELGVHGYHHQLVWEMEAGQFRQDVLRAKQAVEAASGQPSVGYRAAAFSLGERTPWAFEILVEAGFRYDSSSFPFGERRYGAADAPLGPHWLTTARGRLLEIPLSVVEVGSWRLPCCGGGYLRHFPLAYTRWALRQLERSRRRAVFYVHPYELDHQYNSRYLSECLQRTPPWRRAWTRWAQYHNRSRTEPKLRWLLSHASVGPIRTCFEQELTQQGLRTAG